jgi:dienelactone hydrolase
MGLVLPAGRPLGREMKLGGLDAYVVRPTTAPRAAVVLYTDIYGWRFNNTRVWADKLARQTGWVVVVPDFFRGTARTMGQSRDGLMAW